MLLYLVVTLFDIDLTKQLFQAENTLVATKNTVICIMKIVVPHILYITEWHLLRMPKWHLNLSVEHYTLNIYCKWNVHNFDIVIIALKNLCSVCCVIIRHLKADNRLLTYYCTCGVDVYGICWLFPTLCLSRLPQLSWPSNTSPC